MPGEAVWYYAQNGQSIGPMTLEALVQRLPAVGGAGTLVYGPNTADWIEARHIPEIVEAQRGQPGPPTPPRGRRSDEIDYEVFGQEMQYVEVTLDPGEMVVAEAGGMMY